MGPPEASDDNYFWGCFEGQNKQNCYFVVAHLTFMLAAILICHFKDRTTARPGWAMNGLEIILTLFKLGSFFGQIIG